MAAPGFGTSPFILPNMFDSPGNALQQGLAMQERRNERQYELDWRRQRQADADEWRKLNLIQELSDVDKYQTGDAVADALGNQKASEILQKYTAMAASLTPAELQGRISQDIQNTATGMKAMKDELNMSNQQLAALKQKFPSLDTKALDRHYRQDVLQRRVENGEFKNPIHVNPTNMRLDDPDFLAAFVSGDKGIRDEIVNPKTVEKGVQVGMGSPSSYTMMKGDIPFFRKRNFDPDKDVEKGFLKKGINPKMVMKSSVEKLGEQDIELLDQDAYDVFSENAKLELSAKAAQRFPEFYSLSKQDREKVKRRIALEDIEALDQSSFSFGSATKPPHISINAGGGRGSGEEQVNNVYKGIDEIINKNFSKGFTATRFNSLSNDQQEVVKKAANNAGYDVDEGGRNIFLSKDEEGNIKIYKTGEDGKPYIRPEAEIGVLSFPGTNLGKQPGVPEKREVVEMGAQKTPPPAPKPKVEDLRKKYNY